MATSKYGKIVRSIFIIPLVLSLSACTPGKRVKSEPEIDTFEINRLAAEAYEKDDLAESEKYYTKLVKEVPQEILPWFRLGNIYARTNRPEAAIVAYRETLLRDPKYANAWYNMGIVQLKQAANSFREMNIFINPDHPLYDRSTKTFDGILNLIKGDDSE